MSDVSILLRIYVWGRVWMKRLPCFRVHHAENIENKGFYAILVNAVISELVTIRTVLLLIRGVHQKIRRSL